MISVFGAVAITTYAYLSYVSNNQLGIVFGQEPPSSFWEYAYDRTLGRIEVEDFDWVIIKAYMEHPDAWAFGFGFGLGHIPGAAHIPLSMEYYMGGRILPPKSLIVFLLSNGGLLHVFLFSIFLGVLLFKSGGKRNIASPRESVRLGVIAQSILLPLIVVSMLRIYNFEFTMLVFAIFYYGLHDIGERRNFVLGGIR